MLTCIWTAMFEHKQDKLKQDKYENSYLIF